MKFWRTFRKKKPQRRNSDIRASLRRRDEIDKTAGGKKSMRMMTSCMREIQAPVSDLCGLHSIMSDIPEDSSIYHYAKAMNNCGILLADMIENMRLYYTLSADLYEIQNSLFVLRAEIEFLWDSLIDGRQCLSKFSGDQLEKIELQLSIDEGVPSGLVESDSTCVLKVFKSLVENAIQFMLEGTISVKVFVELSEDCSKKCLFHIVVSDTGIGVPDEAREAIFDPLTKAHAESIPGGVGMGLPVSRAMCEVLCGSLILEKDSGLGSVFHASFPMSARNNKPGPRFTDSRTLHRTKTNSWSSLATEIPASSEMPRVLLVEDVHLNRQIVSRMMRDVNVTPSIAEDGLEAVELCRLNKFDVVFMDISMPNMGGIEATEEIKKNCPFNRDTPIIALTGTLAGKMEGPCLKAGMVKCLAKPLKRKDLVESISQVAMPKHRAWMLGHEFT